MLKTKNQTGHDQMILARKKQLVAAGRQGRDAD
jgi:hypothetical protein